MGGSSTDATAVVVDASSSERAKGILGPGKAKDLVVWPEKGVLAGW
jgi:hypothetical protein